MKTVTLLYILSTLSYFMVGDGSMYWGLINHLTLLSMIVVLLNIKINKDIYTQFATHLTVGRVIYSSICAISEVTWIYAMNKVFATIFLIWLIITMIISKIANGGLK